MVSNCTLAFVFTSRSIWSVPNRASVGLFIPIGWREKSAKHTSILMRMRKIVRVSALICCCALAFADLFHQPIGVQLCVWFLPYYTLYEWIYEWIKSKKKRLLINVKKRNKKKKYKKFIYLLWRFGTSSPSSWSCGGGVAFVNGSLHNFAIGRWSVGGFLFDVLLPTSRFP